MKESSNYKKVIIETLNKSVKLADILIEDVSKINSDIEILLDKIIAEEKKGNDVDDLVTKYRVKLGLAYIINNKLGSMSDIIQSYFKLVDELGFNELLSQDILRRKVDYKTDISDIILVGEGENVTTNLKDISLLLQDRIDANKDFTNSEVLDNIKKFRNYKNEES